MVSISEFKSRSLRSFLGRGEYEFACQFWYCEPSVKNQWGRDRRLNYILLFCSLECFNCWWVGGGRVEQKVFPGSAEIVSFVFLVLFKDGGRRVSPRFHLFVSDVSDVLFLFVSNQGNKDVRWVQDLLRGPRGRKTLLTSSASCGK